MALTLRRRDRHDDNGHRHITLQLPLDRARLRALRRRVELRGLHTHLEHRAHRERVRLFALRAVGGAWRSG